MVTKTIVALLESTLKNLGIDCEGTNIRRQTFLVRTKNKLDTKRKKVVTNFQARERLRVIQKERIENSVVSNSSQKRTIMSIARTREVT